MNPLSPLALLSADVDHQHLVFAQMEYCLRDAYRSGARVDDVLFVRYIRWVEQAIKLREKVDQAAQHTRTGARHAGLVSARHVGHKDDRRLTFRAVRPHFLAPKLSERLGRPRVS